MSENMIQCRRDFGFEDILRFIMRHHGRVSYNALYNEFRYTNKYLDVALKIMEIDDIISQNVEMQLSSAVGSEYRMTPIQIARARSQGV